MFSSYRANTNILQKSLWYSRCSKGHDSKSRLTHQRIWKKRRAVISFCWNDKQLMSACPGNVCGLDKTEIVLTGPSTSVQGYYAWSIIYDVRTLNMSPRRTKPTILQCMYDQQRLRSVCASTHYIKHASWIALSPQTVHTVWSSKGLILGGGGPIYGIVRMCVPNSPLFQHCQVYDWPPFFNKSIWMARFFWFPMWKGPFYWHPGICTCFSLRDFSRLLILLVLHELTVIFV